MSEKLSSRERVNITLNHKEPDMIPIDLGGYASTIEVEAYEALKQSLGIEKETEITVWAHAAIDEEVLERFDVDTRYLNPNPRKKWNEIKYNEYITDEWGIVWRKPSSSHYWDAVKYPFESYDYKDLCRFKYNFKWDAKREKDLITRAEDLSINSRYYIVLDAQCFGIFEQCWFLRGMERLFEDILVNKGFANKLFDIVLDARLKLFGKLMECVGSLIGTVIISDDMGTQDGLLISKTLYREFLKPRQAHLIKAIKEKAKVKICRHSCGAVSELIEDFIEEGVDILNPVQVSAKGMDGAGLKREYGDRIVFWGGGCDTQRILESKSPTDIYDEVAKRADQFRKGGGFVFAPTMIIQPGTPPENVIAMMNAIRDVRAYN